MKNNLVKAIAALGLVSSLSTAVTATDFGMAVGIAGVNGLNPTVIRGIVKLEDSMRLEPYVAMNYSNPDSGSSSSNITLGTAFHMIQPLNSKLNAYYGGYADYSTDSLNDFNLGPVAGVEYAFDKEFSIGGEVGLNLGFGNGLNINTITSAVLRYYF